jgi:RNA polymerase sigma-70 factor (ECF subfamily)
MQSFPPLDTTLDAVLQGNADAFLLIVQAYRPSLRAYLAAQMYHLDDVDDVAQETFIAAYRSLPSFRRDQDFGAWLRGIARHKLLRYFETTGRRMDAVEKFRQEAAVLLQPGLDEAAATTRAAHLQAMLACLQKLPDRMHQVVRHWLDGGRSTALAESLETTPGAVHQLQYRALRLLRECMEKETAHGN